MRREGIGKWRGFGIKILDTQFLSTWLVLRGNVALVRPKTGAHLRAMPPLRNGARPMKYQKTEAKAHARETMHGIWAAALNPFDDTLALNEDGLRRNIRHWIDDLEIQGLFIAGKQGEFWSMSIEERKRNMTIAVEECGKKAGTIMSISDQNVDTVLELGRHAQE